ncbi:efflux RND transporter permease subunit [Aquifex aeolicus]|uniref:Cation efflux (AcrB/AcrD/AcrF family) n=1 Tax=Aquifex aeolicus (strain VF5) TaxID=224324 RepID=O66977_AQUAE|nr:efflux RND transporter permease subunit [Aquifex aeolicus]AAC06934.1 cation efflux (AcrB/AcrD/AcrF family) [Aquifex aeolicus VF5]
MQKFFIERPVTAFMLMLSFVFLGLYSLKLVPIDRLPDVEFPVVRISADYPGADPYVVDTNVTRIIEEAVSTVSGIESIISRSYPGFASVVVTFTLDKDIDVATQEVSNAIQRAMRRFPKGVEPPTVVKVDTSVAPIMVLLLYSDTADYQRLTYYADKVIKRELEKLYGVGSVSLGGFRDNVLWVRLKVSELYGYELTPLDVLREIDKNHQDIPAGNVYGKRREYILRLYGKFKTPEELSNLYIKENLRLGDVARVYFGEDEERSLARFNGNRAVALLVFKQAKVNTVRVIDEIKSRMEFFRELLPPDIKLDYTFDASVYVKESIRAAFEEIIIGVFLTAFTVYLFLGNLRLTLVPVFAIPVTILGTIFFLYQLGYSLNTITLLALAVAVGIVIDDAIVVMESIHRRREEGLPPFEAGVKGTRVVMFALLASTSVLIVVFLPVVFLKGVLGTFLKNFALTLIIAIGLSYLVAITFTPSATVRLITQRPRENFFMKLYKRFEGSFDKALRFSLDHKFIVLLLSFFFVGLSVYLFPKVKKEFVPHVDEGRFMVRMRMPVGTSFERVKEKAKEVERILLKNPHIAKVGMVVGEGVGGAGVHSGLFFVYLKERSQRPHQMVVMSEVRRELSELKNVKVSVEPPHGIGASAGRTTDLQYIVRGERIEVLKKIAKSMEEHFSNVEGFRDVDTSLELSAPYVKISVKREKLSHLGVSVEDLGLTLSLLFGKYRVGTYELGSESYDFYIKAEEDFVKEIHNLNRVYIRARNGELIPITELIDFSIEAGPFSLTRYNRQYSFVFYANLEGIDLATARSLVEDWLKKNLPFGYTYDTAGRVKEFKKAFSGFVLSLAMSLIGVYMILASLFESLKHPFTVLLMVPLSALGVFGFMYLTDTSLNVSSYFGIILLVGIIVRDAVLFIERIIQLRKEGYAVREAILEARRERLRPILMTTITVVSALLPVALGLTAGSEQRKPLAIAVIGGIASGLPLSLFLLPVLYELMEWKRK